MKHGLPPIVFPESRTLILGTLPGDESIALQQYYVDPRNQFWSILSAVSGHTASEYSDRLRAIRLSRLALWDVLSRAERAGSLDANIRNEKPNNFASFFTDHPSVRTVIFNGGTSERLFQRHIFRFLPAKLKDELSLRALPSTSATPGRYVLPFDQKVSRWKMALTQHPYHSEH